MLKKKQTEVLLLSQSHQSIHAAYQMNSDYLTAAKNKKSLATSFADAACVDSNDSVTNSDDSTSNLYALQRDQQDLAKLMQELIVELNNTVTEHRKYKFLL